MFFFFSSRRRHTRLQGDWSSDVCSSDLNMHERRWARPCTRIKLVELRLSLSTVSSALGPLKSPALRPPWQRGQLFVGGWARLHDFVENHVRRGKREDRLVLHNNTRRAPAIVGAIAASPSRKQPARLLRLLHPAD